MELNTLIAECTAYDFKVMPEEKKTNSWLKSSELTRICYETEALDGYKNELKPVFKSTPAQSQVIIYASTDTQNVGGYVGDVSEVKLSERQQKKLNLIKESPTITDKQMSETLSVSQRIIECDLSTLQKIGIL